MYPQAVVLTVAKGVSSKDAKMSEVQFFILQECQWKQVLEARPKLRFNNQVHFSLLNNSIKISIRANLQNS